MYNISFYRFKNNQNELKLYNNSVTNPFTWSTKTENSIVQNSNYISGLKYKSTNRNSSVYQIKVNLVHPYLKYNTILCAQNDLLHLINFVAVYHFLWRFHSLLKYYKSRLIYSTTLTICNSIELFTRITAVCFSHQHGRQHL